MDEPAYTMCVPLPFHFAHYDRTVKVVSYTEMMRRQDTYVRA